MKTALFIYELFIYALVLLAVGALLWDMKKGGQKSKWQPKEGEWCWFWDDDNIEAAILARFEKMDGNNYQRIGGFSWKNCQPFKGKLPTHLKGGRN